MGKPIRFKRNPAAAKSLGGFRLYLYCKWMNPAHEWQEFPYVMRGDSGPSVRRHAQSLRWVLHNDGYATCPKCYSAMKWGEE